jgi:bacteriocin-like protein
MSSLKELNENDLQEVSGGVGDTNFPAVLEKLKGANTHDDAWKKRIAAAASAFDSKKFHCCATGCCPGCGAMVGRMGNVCQKCRAEVGA